MDGFELDMSERGFDQRRQAFVLHMQKAFEGIEALHELVGRRGHEDRVSRTRPADPILRSPEFSGLLRASPSLRQTNGVNLADEMKRKRKTAAES